MTNRINKSIFSKAGIIAAAFLLVGLPAFSYAASYAYVDSFGEVRQFTANTSAIAITDAPGIDIHSGVCLMTTQADDDMIGNHVSGM